MKVVTTEDLINIDKKNNRKNTFHTSYGACGK